MPREDARIFIDSRHHVHDYHTLRLKAGRNGEAVTVGFDGPGEDRFRGGLLEVLLQ